MTWTYLSIQVRIHSILNILSSQSFTHHFLTPRLHSHTDPMSSSNPNQPPGPYPPGKHIIPPPRPVSPATAGYRLNHLMLRVKDAEKSLAFYCDCLGMHVVFIFNAGPWTIYYLGGRGVGMYYITFLVSFVFALLGVWGGVHALGRGYLKEDS